MLVSKPDRPHFIQQVASGCLSATLLLASTGCAQVPSLNNWLAGSQLPQAELDMQVAPANAPGVYTIAGKTSLPDQAQMRVLAVRYLHPDQPATQALNPKPTYAILDYQTAEVNQGKWQTTLNLWRVAMNGRYQETWQMDNASLGVALKPDSKVVFLATLMPGSKTDLLQKLEQELEKQGKTLDSSQVRTTTDGQRYIQTSQTLAISLPSGSTTPPPLRSEDINGGWGNRFLIPPEPKNPTRVELPKERRTSAPMTAAEFLR